MKVLVFCAKGFETMEFSAFIDVLGWAGNDYGHDIKVETGGFTRHVISTFNVPVIMDKIIEEIIPEEYDALAIPGGFEEYGFYEEAYDERLLDLIRRFAVLDKIIASICVGALPLGKSGILAGRQGTTYHLKDGYRQRQLKEFGVNIVNEPIAVSDRIITSWCPQTAPYVAFRLLEMLIGMDDTQVIKEAMGYNQHNNYVL